MSDIHECFTYQVAPVELDVPKRNFFHGDVYDGKWIIDSVNQRKLLDPTDYLLETNSEEGSKRMDFNRQQVQYTITEGIKIFELALANPSNSRGAVFWLQVEQKGIIPRRPGESMRNFWKIHTHQGLEAYLARAVKDEHRYCHAFKRIPQVETGLENMSVS